MIRRGGKRSAGKGLPWPDAAQALLLRAAIGPDAGVADALSEWRRMVDLEAEVDGGTYRLLPLAYTRALAAGVDTPVLGLLKGVYRRCWYEAQTLVHATRPALAALHDAGIPVLALKGLPLALAYYRNQASRPMSDIDLVVSRADLARALQALQARGWTHHGAPWSASATAHPAVALRSAAGVEDIDLHWHCLHETPYAEAEEWFWRGAAPLDVSGACVLQPRPTALLLHTLLHGIRSNPEPPIRWIADAGIVLRTAGDAIDWDDLVEFARRHRLARRLYLGLDLLSRDYGIAVPTDSLARLRKLGTSPIEYIENLNYLGGAHGDRRYPRMLGLVAYLRVHRVGGPWRWLRELPNYLAFRWSLPSVHRLPAEAMRRLARRLLPAPEIPRMNRDDAQGVQVSDTPERSEAEQQAFHDAVMQATLEAEARAGIVEHDLLVAGVRIRLMFAGDALATEFMPALSHLVVPAIEDRPDATFHVWDTRSTGVEMVPPPCPRSCFSERGDIWGFNSRRIRSAFQWSEFSVCLFSSIDRVGIYWVDNSDNLAYWTRSSPLRTLFHWAMELHGRQLVHGAAVGTAEGGALIMGKGGVGKSTTSLACLDAGMRFAGDDYVVIGLDPEPVAWSLYCTAKVAPAQLSAFPALQALAMPAAPGDEKAVLLLFPEHQERFVHQLPLRWLLTPGFGDAQETSFEPIAPVALHHAAAFTTMSQLPHAGAHTHAFMGRLVHALPGARLRLGRDVHSTPAALRSLLGQAVVAPAEPPAETPLVSVVIPVFNGAHFLAEAIASVLEQHYPALDIIVVDDGSKDAIEAAVAALPVEVRFARQDNAGPAAARNRGIRMATGELVAFLDVDDLWLPGNLPAMVAQLVSQPGIDVLLGRGQLARISETEAGRELDYIGNPEESFPYYIGAALYRRRVFAEIGGFDEDLYFGEDVDWFKRLEESGPRLGHLPQATLIVRRHDRNMTLGKSAAELNMLRTFKLALDRKRNRAADA